MSMQYVNAYPKMCICLSIKKIWHASNTGEYRDGIVVRSEDNGDLRIQWEGVASTTPSGLAGAAGVEAWGIVHPSKVRYGRNASVEIKTPDGARLLGVVVDVVVGGDYVVWLSKYKCQRTIPSRWVLRLSKKSGVRGNSETEKERERHNLQVFMRNAAGCARAEGFRPIPWEVKQTYLQFSYRPTIRSDQVEVGDEDFFQPKKSDAYGRANRLASRHVGRGMGEVNKNSDAFKFNQLKARLKQLSFRKSGIHGWGLFAEQPIAEEEMVIEYKGEVISNKVCERREQSYETSGIGSSYMFRINKDRVIDATRSGGRARYVNHSCEPNCYTRIIHVSGQPKVVLYSKRAIEEGEELSYDYNFPPEGGTVPCHCGALHCRGFMA